MPKPFPWPLNIGTDICSIPRILGILRKKTGRHFVRRILTIEERDHYRGRVDWPLEKWQETVRRQEQIEWKRNELGISKAELAQCYDLKKSGRPGKPAMWLHQMRLGREQRTTGTELGKLDTMTVPGVSHEGLDAKSNRDTEEYRETPETRSQKTEGDSTTTLASLLVPQAKNGLSDLDIMLHLLEENEIAVHAAQSGLQRAAEFMAGRFAAKEAAIKAHHTERLTYQRVSILPAPVRKSIPGSRPPIAVIVPENGKWQDGQEVKISISHDGDYATAVCLGCGVKTEERSKVPSDLGPLEKDLWKSITPDELRGTNSSSGIQRVTSPRRSTTGAPESIPRSAGSGGSQAPPGIQTQRTSGDNEVKAVILEKILPADSLQQLIFDPALKKDTKLIDFFQMHFTAANQSLYPWRRALLEVIQKLRFESKAVLQSVIVIHNLRPEVSEQDLLNSFSGSRNAWISQIDPCSEGHSNSRYAFVELREYFSSEMVIKDAYKLPMFGNVDIRPLDQILEDEFSRRPLPALALPLLKEVASGAESLAATESDATPRAIPWPRMLAHLLETEKNWIMPPRGLDQPRQPHRLSSLIPILIKCPPRVCTFQYLGSLFTSPDSKPVAVHIQHNFDPHFSYGYVLAPGDFVTLPQDHWAPGLEMSIVDVLSSPRGTPVFFRPLPF